MNAHRRITAIDRLTTALSCTGTCPRCCNHPQAPGNLTPRERAEALVALLERAGLAFDVKAVHSLCTPSEAV